MDDSVKDNWWRRLTGGLRRTSSAVGGAISDLVTKRKLDAETIAEIEDVLIRADLGLDTARRVAEALGDGRYEAGISPDGVKAVVAAEIEEALLPVAQPLAIDAAKKPFVILVAGVNGSGKTTTIGKLAAKFRAEGRSVMLAAGDTFRAAAIEQLKIWGERTHAPVIARGAGADAAGLAFDAVRAAIDQKVDVLLIDTAGRLQNRTELMDELEKIVRVMKKVDASAPHAVLLVLDATVGQNALSQVELFRKAVGVTGLVMTKLDGTARGGILVAIAAKFQVPVHFIGVGESVDDLGAVFRARLRPCHRRPRIPDRWYSHAALESRRPHDRNDQTAAQSVPQACLRSRPAGAVLLRQFPLRHFRRHGDVHGRRHRDPGRVLCADADASRSCRSSPRSSFWCSAD